MAARSIASLSLSFGLVSIPVKLYSATENSASVRFNLLAKDGSRVRQQYVSEGSGKVVERSELVKGYEFEKDRFVLFTPEELKALEEGRSSSIDIVAFIPADAVDPLFYDKAYFIAPDKRGGKPYSLLMEALRRSGRCALARWAWRGKQYVVQVRAAEDGMVVQQLLYADEVRSLAELHIDKVEATEAELKLALQLIDQISQDSYDPAQFQDEERQRILAAIDEKIAGRQIVSSAERAEPARGGQVIDLMEALRASLGQRKAPPAAKTARAASAKDAEEAREAKALPLDKRKGARRAAPAPAEQAAPAKVRARR